LKDEALRRKWEYFRAKQTDAVLKAKLPAVKIKK
jgi:hypothetical protein